MLVRQHCAGAGLTSNGHVPLLMQLVGGHPLHHKSCISWFTRLGLLSFWGAGGLLNVPIVGYTALAEEPRVPVCPGRKPLPAVMLPCQRASLACCIAKLHGLGAVCILGIANCSWANVHLSGTMASRNIWSHLFSNKVSYCMHPNAQVQAAEELR